MIKFQSYNRQGNSRNLALTQKYRERAAAHQKNLGTKEQRVEELGILIISASERDVQRNKNGSRSRGIGRARTDHSANAKSLLHFSARASSRLFLADSRVRIIIATR